MRPIHTKTFTRNCWQYVYIYIYDNLPCAQVPILIAHLPMISRAPLRAGLLAVVVGLSSLSPAQYIARTVWPYQRRPNVPSRQFSTAAKRGQPPTPPEHDGTPACRPGLARPSAHPARVLFDGDELVDGGREKPSAKTMSTQSAPPEPERAGKGTRRMLRSLSLRSAPELPRRIGTAERAARYACTPS